MNCPFKPLKYCRYKFSCPEQRIQFNALILKNFNKSCTIQYGFKSRRDNE